MRIQYIKELFNLTEQQKAALEEEDIETFSKLVEAKQVVIEQIMAYNKKYGDVLSVEERLLLGDIKNLDDVNRKEFDRQYEEAKQKIRDIRRSRNTHDVYNNPYNIYQEEGIFFDKK